MSLVTRQKVVTMEAATTGGSLQWRTSLRLLDRVGENVAHKLPRAESDLFGSSEFPQASPGGSRVDSHGKHVS